MPGVPGLPAKLRHVGVPSVGGLLSIIRWHAGGPSIQLTLGDRVQIEKDLLYGYCTEKAVSANQKIHADCGALWHGCEPGLVSLEA